MLEFLKYVYMCLLWTNSTQFLIGQRCIILCLKGIGILIYSMYLWKKDIAFYHFQYSKFFLDIFQFFWGGMIIHSATDHNGRKPRCYTTMYRFSGRLSVTILTIVIFTHAFTIAQLVSDVASRDPFRKTKRKKPYL